MTNKALLARLGDLIARTTDPRDAALLAKVAERFLTLSLVAELVERRAA